MERDPKKALLERLMMSPEQMEAYAEPSIMDDYIKQNDPEQYDKIVDARNINQAIGMTQGIGGPAGVMGTIGRSSRLGKFLRSAEKGGGGGYNARQLELLKKGTHSPESASKHQMAQTQKQLSRGDMNPELQKFGKVESKALPQEEIGKATLEALPQEEIGKVLTQEQILNKIGKLKDTLTSIKERNLPIDEATKKRTMDVVRELIRQKGMAKHSDK